LNRRACACGAPSPRAWRCQPVDEPANSNVTINNLLPGRFDTDRLKSDLQALATRTKRPAEAVTEEIRSGNPSRRFGRPEEFGATCAFLLGPGELYHRAEYSH
jgi:NAD(P)-dependent dehydrogenase (short-subunit alcohol dehydrogenase family)